AASVVDDGLASEMEVARLRAVLRPKLGGAVVLDSLTRDDPIEFFLLFSSATTLVGAPAQGAYVAANAALEALARRRRAEGLPALAVAWGPIEDAGYLAERPETRDALARRLGAKPTSAAEALAGLPAMIASGLPVVAVGDTNWTEARRFLPILAGSLFSEVRMCGSASPADESLAELLASLDPDEALSLLKTVVAEEAATILRLPASGIDPLRPLSEMGMESSMEPRRNLFGLSAQAKAVLIEKLASTPPMRSSRVARHVEQEADGRAARLDVSELEGFREIRMIREAAEFLGISDPFFRVHEGIAGAETMIGNRVYVNFASYNYVDLNGHPDIVGAAKAAIDRYGT